MKTLFLPTLAALMLVTASCQREAIGPCENVACNAGYCDNGQCKCGQYHRGTHCEEYIVDLISGSWSSSEACSISGTANNTVLISHSSASPTNNITIGPVRGLTMSANAIFHSINIPFQASGQSTFSGSGTINQDLNSIDLQITVLTGFDEEACSVVLTR